MKEPFDSRSDKIAQSNIQSKLSYTASNWTTQGAEIAVAVNL
jgi:hypothetical protein